MCGAHLQPLRRASKRAMNFLGLLLLISVGMVPGEQVLVWEDSFDGNSLNETAWIVKTGNGCDQGDGLCGWGNAEQQTYTEDNHQVADGVLSITAEKVDVQVDERWYTSTRLRTTPNVSFLTGRIEARIQLPAGLGLWAAFWMLPANTTRGVWASTGEIDIMESVNDMEVILGTIHYGGAYPANRFAGCESGQLEAGVVYSDDYHVYAVEWEREEIRWYVDEQLYCLRTSWVSDLDSIEPYRAPFDTEFEIILNLAVGGNLVGRIIDDTIFPATMLVDYVRVYSIDTDVEEAEPFLGAPVCLPGIVQAEAFDSGGLGLGYGEFQPESYGGGYRIDGASLVYSDAGRTFAANLTDTDWLAYTVMTEEATYDVTLEVSAFEAAELRLIIGDGVSCSFPGSDSLTDLIAAPPTGGRGYWEEVLVPGVSMPAGTHSLKLCVTGGSGVDVDRVNFELVEGAAASTLTSAECATSGQSRPYMYGQPWVLPGYMEAEFYDYGGLGVGFHKNNPSTFDGNLALRPTDAVGVVEAESNLVNGPYVGYWEPGEWVAFTARADEEGFWDVGASVASGLNGTSVEFRLLVNATNCSSADTDGFDGLGDEGVDLLGGSLVQGFTGSWEAFEMVYKEEVYVPEGTHRILFCADDGVFNVDYLRVWTPTPTLAPTMAPTIAPTPAPQLPGDDGLGIKWIYIGVSCTIVILALSRLGCIVYSKERNSGRPPPPDTPKPAYMGSRVPAVTSTDSLNSTPSDYAAWIGDGGSGSSSKNLQGSASSSNRDLGKTDKGSGGGAPGMQQQYAELLVSRKEMSRRRSSSFQEPKSLGVVSQTQQWQAIYSSRVGHARVSSSSSSQRSSRDPTLPKENVARPGGGLSATKGQSSLPGVLSGPRSKVLRHSMSMGTDANGVNNPREKSGLEVSQSGSLWDRDVYSPMKAKQKNLSTPSSPKVTTTGQPSPEQVNYGGVRRTSESANAERDQFENALSRALTDKLEGGKLAQVRRNSHSPQHPSKVPALSLSDSSPDEKNLMLRAVKTWTCVCAFDNSVGQPACLGCGRVAPHSRPATPSRIRLPAHRMNSRIDTLPQDV